MKTGLTLLEHLDRIPPFFCLALAGGHNKIRPRLSEIVRESGLNKRTFQRISRRISWAGVKVCQVDKFSAACGVSHNRVWGLKAYIAKTLKCKRPMKHLTARQLIDFQIQCARWKASRLSHEP